MSNIPPRNKAPQSNTAGKRNGQEPVIFGLGVNDSSASQIQFGDAAIAPMASHTPPSPQQRPGGAGPRPPMMAGPGQHYPPGPGPRGYPAYPPAYGYRPQYPPAGFNPYATQYMQPGMFYGGPAGAPMQPQAAANRPPPPQRQKKAIAIIDPTTGKEVELGKAPKHDEKPKEEGKPVEEAKKGGDDSADAEAAAKAKAEAERAAKEEAERAAKEEAERAAKEEAERAAKAEAERVAKEEAERAAKAEAERVAKEEAERAAKAEAERAAKEEAERAAKAEAERAAKEEAERAAKEEAERAAREEAECVAKEEAERVAKAEAERKKRDEEERAAKEAAAQEVPAPLEQNTDGKVAVADAEDLVPTEKPADAGAVEELEEGEIAAEESAPAPREPPTYLPGMWSPDNPDGKRVYPIGFLMAFVDLVSEKPSDMVMYPDVDRELAGQAGPQGGQGGSRGGRGGMQRNQSSGMGAHRQGGPGGDYRGPPGPGMRREPSMGGRGGRGGRGGMMGGPIRGPAGGFGGPRPNFDVPPPMKIGENAWRPPARIDPTKVEDPEQREKVENDLIFRKLKGLLNKLTFENYPKLSEQIMALPITTNMRLKGAIYIVFDKALDEPTFATMYAKLCTLMSKWEIPSEAGEEGQAKNTFRRHLLNKCQEEFEKERQFNVKEGIAAEDVDEALARQKLRMLGNIKFIGELFKLNQLTNKIMHACIQQLLTPKDGQTVPSEEALESLCQLLTTVGKRLETDANAKPHMDAYFNRIKELVQKKDEVTSRVRFMMQDVIELRENKWVPRRAEAQAKTIDEVHKELEQDKLKQLAAGRNDSGRGGRNDSRGGGYNKQQQQNADGWTSVGSNTRSKADLSALRSMQTRPASTGDSTNMKLGPAGGGGGGARGWGMARTPSENKQGGAPALGPSKNAFDILSHPETHEERGPPLRPFMPTLQAPSPKGGRPHSPSAPSPSNLSPAPSPAPSPLPPTELSEDEFKAKAKATAEEYFNLKDLKEAITCFKEYESPALHHLIVAELLASMDNTKTRPEAASLMAKLAEEGVITKEDILTGADATLEMLDDLSMDVPKVHEYLGEYFAPLVQSNVIALADIATCKHFPELVSDMMSQAPLKLLAATAARMDNQDEAKKAWSSVEMDKLVPEGKEAADILKALNCEWLA